MNFVAHAYVSLSLAGSGNDEAFGAILPDLASIAGVRYDRDWLPPSVRNGVEIHHATDSAFHASLRFHSGSAALRAALFEEGISTGPTRAVGHAGFELLLDGCLLERPGIGSAFIGVLQGAPDVTEAVTAGNPERLRQVLVSLRADEWWRGYRDPDVVAQRLYRRLLGRPRLRFGSTEVAAVSRALHSVRPSVAAALDGLLAETVDAVGHGKLDS